MKAKLFYIPICFFMLSVISCNKDDEENKPFTDTPNNSGTQNISHNGVNREYNLYIPSSYNSSAAASVIFTFHGFGGNSLGFLDETNLKTIAETNNIILISPQGSLLDGSPHWNTCPIGGDNKSNADDFGFIETLLNQVKSQYNVDSKKVYAVGYSNGGMMSYGLAQHKSELFAAVGSVSGTMLDCYGPPLHPIPVIHLHGTNDYVIPYNGNEYYSSAQDVISYWVNFNKSDTLPTITEDNNIEHYIYKDGNRGVNVEHYKYKNGSHIWFNSTFNGKNTGALIWEFFSSYDINGAIEE